MDAEIWHGRYDYLELDFHSQNVALKINNPLEPGYKPGARFIKSNRGNLAIYDPNNKPANLRLSR